MHVKKILITILSVTGLAGCDNHKNQSTNYEPSPVKTVSTPTEGKQLDVPSDPGAQFYVLDKAKKNGQSVIITKRVGTSGVSYSSRLYDCSNYTVKYLGTGETRQEMEQSSPDPNMAPIVNGSIADYVGREACK